MRDVIEIVRFRPDHAAYHDRAGGTPRERVLAKLAVTINGLEHRAHWVAWLSWVEQRRIADIVAITQIPLEVVEHLLEEVVLQLADASDDGGGHRRHADFDGDAFWRAMEAGDE